ncbi:MAG: MFS transporter [Solirubrobacterales bacterium]|nr:MFS transporter [Solirubrobacterales bacterium]
MLRSDERAEARRIVGDENARKALQKRTLITVVISQVLGGAGLAAGITVGALIVRDMLGSDSLSGLPSALFTLGAASFAFLIGRMAQRSTRRAGLGLGFATGGIGAIGVVLAVSIDSLPLLFAALFIYGAGTAANLQARYTGTDLAPERARGKAASVSMVSTTLGAVAGPNLVEPMGRLAEALGIPPLAGPFMLAAVAYLAAGSVLFLMLRPDPLLVSRLLASDAGPEAPPTPPEDTGELPGPTGAPAAVAIAPRRINRGVAVAATVMVVTQVAMVGIMTMTPVHMRDHGHHLGAVGLVIGIHIGFMYLPSLITGAMVDRIGRYPMAAASGVTLFLAGLVAALASPDSLFILIVALSLLGLGWNFGLISGTAIMVDSTTPENRAATQGTVDVLINLGGAAGGAMSGLVMAGAGYATLSLAGGLLSLLLLGVLWRHASPTQPGIVAPAGEDSA